MNFYQHMSGGSKKKKKPQKLEQTFYENIYLRLTWGWVEQNIHEDPGRRVDGTANSLTLGPWLEWQEEIRGRHAHTCTCDCDNLNTIRCHSHRRHLPL